MRTKAVDSQHRQREQHTPAKIGYTKDIRQFLEHLGHFFFSFVGFLGSSAAAPPINSILPPALVIFSWADLENRCARTVSADLSSPSPSTLIKSFLCTIPCLISSSGVML